MKVNSGDSFDSLKDIIYNLGSFLFEYNHLRKHGGLEYITPYEKLEKVTELLSKYNRPLVGLKKYIKKKRVFWTSRRT